MILWIKVESKNMRGFFIINDRVLIFLKFGYYPLVNIKLKFPFNDWKKYLRNKYTFNDRIYILSLRIGR